MKVIFIILPIIALVFGDDFYRPSESNFEMELLKLLN